jgi:hypothetical protein
MRKLLFISLLFPVLSIGQRSKDYDLAYWKYKPDSLVVPIKMPVRDFNPNYEWDMDLSYDQKIRVAVIRSDTDYRNLFWRYVHTEDSLNKYKKDGVDAWTYKWAKEHHVDSLPSVDFARYELLLYAACPQCLAYCEHDSGKTSCHRNACNFREAWFVREKK